MLEGLTEKLANAFKRFRSKGKLTAADVKEGMREIKLALLEADVNFKVVKDFLSNVFGGIQIVSNHPFKVGDYVEVAGTSGSVSEVGLFYTKLSTPDKKLVQIPNSKIANDCIVNYSNSPTRRVEFLVSTAYDNDTEKVRNVLLQLINEHPMVLHEEGQMPVVHVKEFKDSDILYTARAWCENQNYWTLYFDIMNAIKPTFDKNGVKFTYPHVNVHMLED